MMAPPRELDIKRMVEVCESNSFDENSGSFVALKWVGTVGTHCVYPNRLVGSLNSIIRFIVHSR